MSTKRIFSLAAIGLSDVEMRMLKSLCLVSGSRARSYAIADEAQAAAADLWIVDARNAREMNAVEQFRAKRRLPIVLVTTEDTATKEPYA